jgi:hypothetical protein
MRRLNMARSALRRADAAIASVAEIGPNPSIPAAGALRRELPHRTRRNALVDAAALADQNDVIKIFQPKWHSACKAIYRKSDR